MCFHPVFYCLLNYKLLFSLSLSVWLPPSLSISRCLTLLSDYCEVLKRNQRGICAPLCRSVPVLSVVSSSHLILHFCPPRHMHTISDTHTHTHTTAQTQRELNFGCLCVSCARCKAKRCLTSSPPPRPYRHVRKRKGKWLCDPGIHYTLCGRCCCLVFVRLWPAFCRNGWSLTARVKVLHGAWLLKRSIYQRFVNCDTLV